MASKKTKLTINDVNHVANLAKLSLTPKELKKFQSQLAKIFDYIDLIGEMETQNVIETSHATGSENILREDEVDKSKMLSQEEVLSNAPDKQNGFFKVKKIFEE